MAFSSPYVVYKYLKGKFPHHSFILKEIREFERNEVFPSQLNKEIRVKKKKDASNRVWSFGLDDLWQLDLVDMHRNRKNEHFVLSKIDVTSKKGDLIVIGRKTARNTLRGIKKNDREKWWGRTDKDSNG